MPSGVLEARLLEYEQPARANGETADDWRRIGVGLRREHERGEANRSRQMWCVGDWLIAGEDRIFSRLKKRTVRKLAVEITGYSQHTLVMAVSVSRKIDPSVRVDALSWWHHLAVAGLPADEQARWLCEAAEYGWSIRALRSRLSEQGRTSSRSRQPRGEQLVRQVVALGPGEVGDDLLAQLHTWLNEQLGQRRRAPAEAAIRQKTA